MLHSKIQINAPVVAPVVTEKPGGNTFIVLQHTDLLQNSRWTLVLIPTRSMHGIYSCIQSKQVRACLDGRHMSEQTETRTAENRHCIVNHASAQGIEMLH